MSSRDVPTTATASCRIGSGSFLAHLFERSIGLCGDGHARALCERWKMSTAAVCIFPVPAVRWMRVVSWESIRPRTRSCDR
jgi:hypothetical protein